MQKNVLISGLILASLFIIPLGFAKALTDTQVKNMIIKESIADYPGNCPCPYNTARNGSSCGGRSAYSRAGGYQPVCYPKDVTRQMIQDYREAHK